MTHITTMRSVTQVAKQIISEIPDEYNSMKEDFNRIFESIAWAPPEKIKSPYYWNILSNILNKHITMDDYQQKEWCKKVIDIFQEPRSVTDL